MPARDAYMHKKDVMCSRHDFLPYAGIRLFWRIHEAVRDAQVDRLSPCVAALRLFGAHVHRKLPEWAGDGRNCTEMLRCADAEALETLYYEGGSLRSQDGRNGWPLLETVCRFEELDALEFVLDQSFPSYFQTDEIGTVFKTCAAANNLRLVERLSAYPGVNQHFEMAFFHAAARGAMKTTEYLSSRTLNWAKAVLANASNMDASVALCDLLKWGKRSPEEEAVSADECLKGCMVFSSNVGFAQYLIETRGANPVVCIHDAIAARHFAFVKLFVTQFKVDVELRSAAHHNRTLLQLAFSTLFYDWSCVDFLLEQGADPDSGPDDMGKSCIHWVAHGHPKDPAELLQKHGADLQRLDREGNSMLHLYCMARPDAQGLHELIVGLGFDPEQRNNLGNSAFDLVGRELIEEALQWREDE